MSIEKKVHLRKLKEMKEEDYRHISSKSLKLEPLTAIKGIVHLDNGWLVTLPGVVVMDKEIEGKNCIGLVIQG